MTNDSVAPREFWITNSYCGVYEKQMNNATHVIEMSAYQALKIKYDRLWDSRDLAKSDLQKRCEDNENKRIHDMAELIDLRKAVLEMNETFIELDDDTFISFPEWHKLKEENSALKQKCEKLETTIKWIQQFDKVIDMEKENQELQSKLAEQAAEIEMFREKFQDIK